MKRKCSIICTKIFGIIILVVLSCGCGTQLPDYYDAASFETALNNGEDVIGKVVVFDVLVISADTEYGYDIWSGNHLNFCSQEIWDVQCGDVLKGKILSVAGVGDSYIIRYKMLSDVQIKKDENNSGDPFQNTNTMSGQKVIENDRDLAGRIYTAFLMAMLDPDVVIADDYHSSIEQLKEGIEITSYAGPYKMGENSVFCAAAKMMELSDFSELSADIQTPGASGKIFVTLYDDNEIKVEIDGTGIVVSSFDDYM